jgi:hypothetical protein
MSKKMMAVITLGTYVVFSTSCVTWRRQEVNAFVKPLPENTKVLTVVKTSGEVVQFSKAEPGLVRGFAIVGKGRVTKMREIAGPFLSVKKDKDGRIIEVTGADGHVYSVQTLLSQGADRMSFVGSELVNVSIPLSGIYQVEFKKTDTLMTVMLVLGVIGGGLALFFTSWVPE